MLTEAEAGRGPKVAYESSLTGIWVKGKAIPSKGAVVLRIQEDPFKLHLSIRLAEGDGGGGTDIVECEVTTPWLTRLLTGWLEDGSGEIFGPSLHPSVWAWVSHAGRTPPIADLCDWLLWRLEVTESQKLAPRDLAKYFESSSELPLLYPATTSSERGDSTSMDEEAEPPPSYLEATQELNDSSRLEYESTGEWLDDLWDDGGEDDAESPPPSYRSLQFEEKENLNRDGSVGPLGNQRKPVKSVDKRDWDEDRYRLGKDLLLETKNLWDIKEDYRKARAITQERRKQTQKKSEKRADASRRAVKWSKWCKQATSDVLALQEIGRKLEGEIKREACAAIRAQRYSEPFPQRRGKWKKGPVIGPGPLPREAMISHVTPGVQRAIDLFEWDKNGRRRSKSRRRRTGNPLRDAMDEIRHQAIQAETSTQALDLKSVFTKFDTNMDGTLSLRELGLSLIDMKIDLGEEELLALFKYLDPDRSGRIRFSEFVWSFFNRRKFAPAASVSSIPTVVK